ncbi:hypothetical protein NQZ68_038466 [Dissostichus eleginoides]|nr:hypothetical protein NQZ68_038466 [Dissostichus eleginoides]
MYANVSSSESELESEDEEKTSTWSDGVLRSDAGRHRTDEEEMSRVSSTHAGVYIDLKGIQQEEFPRHLKLSISLFPKTQFIRFLVTDVFLDSEVMRE